MHRGKPGLCALRRPLWGMSTRGDMPDWADDRLLCVVIATGMFITAAPGVLQLLWLVGLVIGSLLWRRHAQRTPRAGTRP